MTDFSPQRSGSAPDGQSQSQGGLSPVALADRRRQGAGLWNWLAWGLPLILMLGTLLMLWPMVGAGKLLSANHQTKIQGSRWIGCPTQSLYALLNITREPNLWHRNLNSYGCRILPAGQAVTVTDTDDPQNQIQVSWPGGGRYLTTRSAIVAR